MSSKLHVLVSYPYMKKKLIEELVKNKDRINLLIDSGAFTAWKSGKPIQLDDYCRFLDALPITPWKYFALDVIGDPIKTMENYQTMVKRGYNPIPVFTPSQDFADIEEYYKTTDFIGCGGLTDKYGSSGLVYLKKIFTYTKGRPIHLLGFTKPVIVKHFKPYSCDSSSWTRSQRYGLCDIYIGKGEYIQLSRRQAINKPRAEICNAIKNLGFTVSDLAKEASWRGDTNIATIISARTWVKYMIDAEKNIKTKLFLTVGDTNGLNTALKEWDYWNAPSRT